MTSATWHIGSGRLTLTQGDITRAAVDAVVNAANTRLAGGGGVDGAIHRAAGPRLYTACEEIVARQGFLPTGQAVATPGSDLPARWVIHTVGPVWHGGTHGEPKLLAEAYANSLKAAHELKAETVAFPAVSCGVYGYPLESAAPLAVAELARGLTAGLVREAILYLYSAGAYAQWRGLAEVALGRPPDETN